MTDLGTALRAAREAAGVSLAAMAARKPEHVEAYGLALNISPEILRGPSDDPLRVAHEWLASDSPSVVQLRAGRRIGGMLAGELENRVIELRRLDDLIGGGDLFPVVSKELSEVRKVVQSASYADRIGKRLLTVVGELAQLAGWVASDAGRCAEAQQIYLEGVSAAQVAADRPLAGQLLSSLSYQLANVGKPQDAALLAKSAVKGAGDTSPLVRALLLERVAWASARNRDYPGVRRTLAAVDDAYEDRSPGIAEPDWVYWLDRKEVDVMAGRCLIELGNPHAAAPLLARAIDSYDVARAREMALYLSWLAEACVRERILDAAHDALTRACKIARGINSARLDLRINQVEILFS